MKFLGWAPVGTDLCPTVCSILEVVEQKVDNNTVEAVPEVDKVPHIKESMKRIVEMFQKKQEGLKISKRSFLTIWLLLTVFIFACNKSGFPFTYGSLLAFDTDKVNANHSSH